MIEIKNFTYGYGKTGRCVFSDFDFRFEPGCVYGLLGENGVGKSTLLHAMMGLLRPRAGAIRFGGTDVCERRPSVLSDCYIVPEEYDLPRISLSDYVRINAPFYPKFSRSDFERYLAGFELPAALNLKSLSMGQKKKVVMCFALATNASLLLMDEPTNGLDILSKSLFRKVMAQGMNESRTIVISTHQVRDVENMLDRVVILGRQGILFDRTVGEAARHLRFGIGAPDAIFAAPSLQGLATISRGDGVTDSAVNIELLFCAVQADARKINDCFTNQR